MKLLAISIPHARSLILSTLSGMLLLSFVCSAAIRAGHADAPIAATAEETRPLEAGQPAPRFVVQTVEGESWSFDPSALDRPVILITFRGGWCPYCNMHLSDLRHVIPEIAGLGIDVIFMSGDRPDLLFASLEDETQQDIDGSDYTIMSDANANAAMALGIAFRASDRTINRRHEKGDDIEESSMSRHGVLPVPAVFAIGTDGVIAFSFAEPDYEIRLDADELLTVAKSLASD